MLLRTIFKNFLSFADEVQFDMFPNIKRTTLSSHIYQSESGVPLLKMASLYGANGAGKSNLIKVFYFLKRVATSKDFLNEEVVLRYLYALREGYEEQMLEVAVEFTTKSGSPYIYSLEVSRKGIEKELLQKSGLGRQENEEVFSREGSEVTYAQPLPKAVQGIIEKWLERNPYSSMLTINSDMPVLSDKSFGEAVNWFVNELDVVSIDTKAPLLIALYRHSEDINRFASKLFSEVGLGIDSVKVKTENFDEWLQNHRFADIPSVDKLDEQSIITHMWGSTNIYDLIKEDGIKKISQFMFEQMGRGGYKKDMDILSQSDGTKRLLILVPALYNAMKAGKTVFVDEIEHSIHPHLVRGLVRYFSEQETTGQLIFSTHETCLLSQDIVRADEVWFAEKEEGCSHLYSLNDFKPHNTIDIEKGYLEGRYGAVPFIGELKM